MPIRAYPTKPSALYRVGQALQGVGQAASGYVKDWREQQRFEQEDRLKNFQWDILQKQQKEDQ